MSAVEAHGLPLCVMQCTSAYPCPPEKIGLNVLAGAVSWFQASGAPLWPAIAGAILSYAASAIWLYEKPRPGIVALGLIAATSICGNRAHASRN